MDLINKYILKITEKKSFDPKFIPHRDLCVTFKLRLNDPFVKIAAIPEDTQNP